MSASRIHELAIVAQRAHIHAGGASFAAERGDIGGDEAESALSAARACDAELAQALEALARDAPAEHERLLARLRESLVAHDDARTISRVKEWLDAGAPPEHRDAAWVIVLLLGPEA